MAGLMRPTGLAIATGTRATGCKAEDTIDPTSVPGKVEIWHRTITFPPSGPVPPLPQAGWG
jgi:hypothetical protein